MTAVIAVVAILAILDATLVTFGVVFLVGLRRKQKRHPLTHADVDRLAKKARRVKARG
jgi:hypothetical protein